MFKYLSILFLAAGFSLPALSTTVSVTTIDAEEQPCPGVDGKITVKVADVPNNIPMVVVNIKCNDDPLTGMNYNGGINISNGKGETEAIILRNYNINKGDLCTVYAELGGNKEVKTSFEVSSNQPPPPFEISNSNSVTVGTEFAIHKLSRFYVGSGPRFKELVLRECTASTDPWIFLHVPYGKDNLLVRVYPRLTTDDTPPKSAGRYQQQR